jgi:superfamily II DNA/RNA helicase
MPTTFSIGSFGPEFLPTVEQVGYVEMTAIQEKSLYRLPQGELLPVV